MRDRGSVIPLMLGMVLLAMLMVAGSVAAGDAFIHQRDLQDVCDGAAVAAAGAADFARNRRPADAASLALADVQSAVDAYLARDQQRRGVRAETQVTHRADGDVVSVACTERRAVVFGAVFGVGDGVLHRASATARAPFLTRP